MAEIIKGRGSSDFLRLQNKWCQVEGIAQNIMVVKSGWTGRRRARGRRIEREMERRLQAESFEGLESKPKR